MAMVRMGITAIGKWICALTFGVLILMSPAEAAKIYTWDSKYISFEGAIAPGDLAVLKEAYKSLPSLAQTATIIDFDSPGGDLREAMAIGLWIRKTGLWTAVSDDEICASACVFVFAGGVTKIQMGQLIIHRPFLTRMPDEDVDIAMKDMLLSSKKYFAIMNIPVDLAEKMFSIPPDQARALTASEVQYYRLDREDMAYAEERVLKEIQRLGISRQEYMKRLHAYQQSPELRTCLQISDFDKMLSCSMKAGETYGLPSD